ncbi:MAG: hypothetical protein N3C12_02585 [Candidatus Binatia bacterium]|nr:hypothetical protein [Candidatus Binatia bacterium]
MALRRLVTGAYVAVILGATPLASPLGKWVAWAQPKQLPTIRFVIPNVEQTRAAATGTPSRPTPAHAAAPADYWWNQPDYIEAFGLSPEQRQRMDAAMVHTQEETEQAIRKQNQARDRFHESVKKRDWNSARQAVEEWERAFAAQWSVGNRAKLAVLELLTPGQHEKLLKEHAYLLDRPWTLGRRFQIHRGPQGAPALVGTPSPPPSGATQ